MFSFVKHIFITNFISDKWYMYSKITIVYNINKFRMMMMINPLERFFGMEGHAALDRNPGPGYDTLLLQLILGNL